MSLNVLSSLALDNKDPYYWDRIDEEISMELTDIEAGIDGGLSYEQRERIRREALFVEFDGDDVHIVVDEDRFMNLLNR